MSITKIPTLQKKEELLEYLDSRLVPRDDEKKINAEVFTPSSFVDHILDILQKENPLIFSNKDYKWLDPANGIGQFPVALFYRLMTGLKDEIQDTEERKRHILENMLFICEINDDNNTIFKTIFESKKYSLNYYNDFLCLDCQKIFGVDKFDVIIGNPPYQKMGKGESIGVSSPIYNKFIEKSLTISEITIFVTPSRWFSGGKGLDLFRNNMLSRRDIRVIKHYPGNRNVFKHVNISGGVSILYIDKKYNGSCKFISNGKETMVDLSKFDIITEPNYIPLIEKFINYKSLESISRTRNAYCIETNGKRKGEDIFIDKEDSKDDLLLCHTSKKYGFIKYIKKDVITSILGEEKLKSLQYMKVITAKTGNRKDFGRTLVCQSNEVHSNSYFSFRVKNINEANSLMSYMKTKLVRVMLGLRKNTQDISPEKCKWIPLVPFDREWNCREVETYFDLSEDLKKMIDEYCLENKINLSCSKNQGTNTYKSKKDNTPKIETNISFDDITIIEKDGTFTEISRDKMKKYKICELRNMANVNSICLRGLSKKVDIIEKICSNHTIRM